MACCDEETARTMTYVLKRAGKTITGPTIRMAEIVGVTWGNMRVASRIVGIDGVHVTVQAMAFDLERNFAHGAEVKRRITYSDGRRYSDDMIVVTCNGAASIAERNAILRSVPKAYWGPVWERAQVIARGGGAPADVAKQRAQAISAFGRLRVGAERVLASVHKSKVEDLDLDDLETLRGIYNAIQEGSTTVDEAFPLPNGVKTSKPLRMAESVREPGDDSLEAQIAK